MVSAVFHGPFEAPTPSATAPAMTPATSKSIAANDPTTPGSMQKDLKINANSAPPAPAIDWRGGARDGVGFPIPLDSTSISVPAGKQWVVSGAVRHPAMFGIGAGIEQNTHRIGECVDQRELQHAIAVLARFPRAFADLTGTVAG